VQAGAVGVPLEKLSKILLQSGITDTYIRVVAE
jgi:hypothetical protein